MFPDLAGEAGCYRAEPPGFIHGEHQDEFEDVGAIRIIRYHSVQWAKNTLRIGCEYEYYCPFDTGKQQVKAKLIVLKGGSEKGN